METPAYESPIWLVLGLVIIVVGLGIAAHRLWTLYRIMRLGQDAPERPQDPRQAVAAEAVEVVGQRKLLKWTVPGVAHVMAFYGFLVLGLTIIEAFGALVDREFSIPVLENWPIIAFVEDLFAVLVLVAIIVFAVIRLREAPKKLGRQSRFFGSHLGAAWFVLFMIFNVVWTLLLYRAAQINTGNFPYSGGGFASEWVAGLLPEGETVNGWLEVIGILLQLAVIVGFLVLVVYSKHLHIFMAPVNVFFSRRPNALGPMLPMYTGKTPINFEDPGEDDVFGRGKIDDFTWKGLLDFATCTECGRCQSQCPAWNTGKPLSPKLLIMSLRDHAFAKAPYLLSTGTRSAAASSTPTSCGPARRAARAWSSAPSTSSTSTTSPTCGASR